MSQNSTIRELPPFAARLRAERDRVGLTQLELALKTGTCPSTISIWERGTHSPSIRNLRRLAAALGVELSVLRSSIQHASAA